MPTTTTDPTSVRGRLSSRRGALVVTSAFVLLLATGCATGSTETDTAASSPSATVSQQTPATAGSSATEIDANTLLQGALDRYKDGYRFEATASVGDAEAVTITGLIIGASAEMAVTSGDGTATYVITPERSWIRVDDGEWHVVDARGPMDSPLDDLASPKTLTVIESSDDRVALLAVYDGAGFDSEDTVDLRLMFVDGFLALASYTTADASVSTTFSPLNGATIKEPAANR